MASIADFLARLALLVVDVRLGLFAQRPAQLQHDGLGHQHAQVGVRADLDGVAAGALAAGALRPSAGRTARPAPAPGARPYWPRPDGPCSSQAWPRWASSCRACAGDPGRLRGHAQPALGRAAPPARRCQTASRGWSASIRAKRAGSCLHAQVVAGGHAAEELDAAATRTCPARGRRPGGWPRSTGRGRTASVRSGCAQRLGRACCCTQRSSCASTVQSKPRPPPW